MRKPRLNANSVANHYAADGERIAEFSFPGADVEGGNLAGGLISFRYMRDGPPLVAVYNVTGCTVATPEVWVLVIDHRHGTDSFARATEAGAVARAAEWAREWWAERPSAAPESFEGLSDADTVSAYFEDHSDEWHTITRCDVGA